MQKDRLLYLLNKYETNSCSKKELQELEEWYESLNETGRAIEPNEVSVLTEEMHEEFKRKLEETGVGGRVISLKKKRWLRVSTAAAVIGLISISAYLLINHPHKPEVAKTENILFKNDVAPGSSKAVLTLANGSSIILDTVHTGSIAEQGKAKIIKLDSGQLAYNGEMSNSESGEPVRYNTLTTPNGGQYQITLSDGTKVWLNAASSLRYPTVFTGKTRNVELTGEAYFEVAHNAAMPFHVKVNDADVQVLGTHFNINAYPGESSIKTTLLEGSVKITKGAATGLLKPGEQAQINYSDEIKVTGDVDLDEVMAWQHGIFKFNDATIQEIMNQVARWYNVQVEYKENISEHFVSTIPRNVPVSEVFKILEATGRVHFMIDGRKIIVMK